MVDSDLAEIDSWLALPSDRFASSVFSDMRRRFLGIIGHSDFLDPNISSGKLTGIPLHIKTVGRQAYEHLEIIHKRLQSKELTLNDPKQALELLTLLVDEIEPFVDEISDLIEQVPPSQNPTIISADWNIRQNNLVRLRRLLHVCQVYVENLALDN